MLTRDALQGSIGNEHLKRELSGTGRCTNDTTACSIVLAGHLTMKCIQETNASVRLLDLLKLYILHGIED